MTRSNSPLFSVNPKCATFLPCVAFIVLMHGRMHAQAETNGALALDLLFPTSLRAKKLDNKKNKPDCLFPLVNAYHLCVNWLIMGIQSQFSSHITFTVLCVLRQLFKSTPQPLSVSFWGALPSQNTAFLFEPQCDQNPPFIRLYSTIIITPD